MSEQPRKQQRLGSPTKASHEDSKCDVQTAKHVATEMLKQGTSEWLQARIGNITASSAAKIVCLGYVPKASRTKELAQHQMNRNAYYESVRDRLELKVPPNNAMSWGSKNEGRAAAAYMELRAMCDRPLPPESFQTAGLFMSKKLHRVAASPDGLVPDWGPDGSGHGLVEIKCPYSNWEGRLIKKDGTQDVPLSYIIQMMLQMLVTESKWCDYVTWTPGGMTVFKLEYDDELGDLLKEHCNEFIAAAERGDAEPPLLSSCEIWGIADIVRRVKDSMTLRAQIPYKLTEEGVRKCIVTSAN